MDLLDFARGPALVFAIAVFVIGTAWRLVGILRLPRMPDLSPARAGAPSRLAAAWHAHDSSLGVQLPDGANDVGRRDPEEVEQV